MFIDINLTYTMLNHFYSLNSSDKSPYGKYSNKK